MEHVLAAHESVGRCRCGRWEVRLHYRPFPVAHRGWIGVGHRAILLAGVVRPHDKSPEALATPIDSQGETALKSLSENQHFQEPNRLLEFWYFLRRCAALTLISVFPV